MLNTNCDKSRRLKFTVKFLLRPLKLLRRMEVAGVVISSPLCIAAREGNIEVVKEFLAKGHNPVLHDNRGWTPLHEAVAHGQLECVKFFLTLDVFDINARTCVGATPLILACIEQNNLELINVLIEFGANINMGTREDETPLHFACKHFKLEMIKLLLDHGADVNSRDFNSFTPLLEAIDQFPNANPVDSERCFQVVRLLLDHGADISKTDEHGRTPFFLAATRNWEKCAKLLLELGAHVDCCTLDGSTSLTLAAQDGNLQMVKFLLNTGADPEKMNENGTMPLHHALHNDYISVAEELVQKMRIKKIIGRKSRKLESFLILAIDSSSFESFKFVMKHKMYSHIDRITLTSSDRNTRLNHFYFRHYQYQSPISFLLYHHLKLPHSLQMLKDLLSTGMYSANSKFPDDVPPLVALVAGGDYVDNSDWIKNMRTECFHVLIKHGAEVDYCSSYDCSGIPDCVLAAMSPWTCSSSQTLLLPILAHCFTCTWDELLEWLAKHQTVNVQVLKALLHLSSKSQKALKETLSCLRKCYCVLCESEYPTIEKMIGEKTSTLKSLCRLEVRAWLWRQRMNHNVSVESVLNDMPIPREVKEYILPVHF